MRAGCVALAWLLVAGFAHAVTGDVREPVESEGFMLVKPQAWSPAGSAQVMEFVGYEDRTARGGGGGYYVVTTKSGRQRQVMASRVVGLVAKPVRPTTLMDAGARDALQAALDGYVALKARHPQAAGLLDGYTEGIRADIERFDRGEVLEDGEWMTKEEHDQGQIDHSLAVLRKNLEEAPRARDFAIETNTFFTKLQPFAADNPGLAERLRELVAEHALRCSLEEQEEIIGKMRAGGFSDAEAVILLERLAGLPDPSTDTSLVLLRWNQAKDYQVGAEALAERMEEAHAGGSALVESDRDFANNLGLQLAKVEGFLGADPPPPRGIPVPDALLKAMDALSDGAGRLAVLLEERRLVEARDLLGTLERHAALVGPSTRSAINLQRINLGEVIAEFGTLRKVGDDAWNKGRRDEALQAYRSALAVAYDEEVAARVAELEGGH